MRPVSALRRRGASLMAYGLVVGLVAVVALSAISGAGGSVNRLFGTVSSRLQGAAPASAPTAMPTAVPTGVLVPGDTGLVVNRNGISARCTQWSGRRCIAPELRPAPTTLYDTCGGQFSTAVWYFIWNQDQADQKFCLTATGSASVESTAARPQSSVPYNYFHGNNGSPFNGTQCARDIGVTGAGAAILWTFTAYGQQSSGNIYSGSDGLSITCSGW